MPRQNQHRSTSAHCHMTAIFFGALLACWVGWFAAPPTVSAQETEAATCQRLHDTQRASRGDQVDEVFAACFPAQDGVWGLVCDDYEASGWGDNLFCENWWIVFLGFDESELEYQTSFGESIDSGYRYDWHEYDVAALDFDGIEVTELYVDAGRCRDEGNVDHREITIVTVSGGEIERWPGSVGLEVTGHRDVDGDGLEDLLYTSHHFYTESCGEFSCLEFKLRFLAHTLADGRVSMDDNIAQDWVRRWCPAPPTIDRLDVEPLRFYQMLETLACLRLWGTDPAPMLAAVAQRCRARPTNNDDQGDHDPWDDICENGEDLERVLEFDVPLQLTHELDDTEAEQGPTGF